MFYVSVKPFPSDFGSAFDRNLVLLTGLMNFIIYLIQLINDFNLI